MADLKRYRTTELGDLYIHIDDHKAIVETMQEIQKVDIQTILTMQNKIEELEKNCATCGVLNCGLSCSKNGTGIKSKWRVKRIR